MPDSKFYQRTHYVDFVIKNEEVDETSLTDLKNNFLKLFDILILFIMENWSKLKSGMTKVLEYLTYHTIFILINLFNCNVSKTKYKL